MVTAVSLISGKFKKNMIRKRCLATFSKTLPRCNDGACIDFSQRCDTKFDCPDLTDELDCPTPCR